MKPSISAPTEAPMSRERDWVEAVKNDIEDTLTRQGITVAIGYNLPYAFQVGSYRTSSDEPPTNRKRALPEPVTVSHGYQTDLLIGEQLDTNVWVPRVVVEFKFGAVTTHDALTYSAKAATHKNVHPYLRYGIVIGGFEGQVPRRLIRHGDHFDFMATLASRSKKLSERDRGRRSRYSRRRWRHPEQ